MTTGSQYYIGQCVIKKVKTDEGYKWEIRKSSTEDKNGIFSGISESKDLIITVGDSSGNKKYNIYQLGIQTLPGVSFTINNIVAMNSQSSGIIIGQTGIFELNLKDGIPINTVTFNNLNPLTTQDDIGYLIIDVVYTINSTEVTPQ